MTLRSSAVTRMSLGLTAIIFLGCGGSDPQPDGGAGRGGGTAGSGGGTAGSGGGAAGSGGGAAGTGGGAAGSGGGAAGSGGGAAGAGGGAAGAGGGGQAGRGGSGGGGQAGRGGSGGGGQAGRGGASGGGGATTASPMMNFFVTSDTKPTGVLGGLSGADDRCQTLAAAVGAGAKTWRAYLCAVTPATNARDRIGAGPYYNSAGTMLAADKDALHARSGDAALFIDEKGQRINGQWANSPTPNQHDILTGCNGMGMLTATGTCSDWTGTTGMSAVGHADGLGPSMSTTPPTNQWTGAHEGFCNDTVMRGGAGKIYCFVGP